MLHLSWFSITHQEQGQKVLFATNLTNHHIDSETLSLSKRGIQVADLSLFTGNPSESFARADAYAQHRYYSVTIPKSADRKQIKAQLTNLKKLHPNVPENDMMQKNRQMPFITFSQIDQEVYIDNESFGRDQPYWVYILAYNDYSNLYVACYNWTR